MSNALRGPVRLARCIFCRIYNIFYFVDPSCEDRHGNAVYICNLGNLRSAKDGDDNVPLEVIGLSKLPCGQPHLDLNVSDSTLAAFAAAALPQVPGLHSLALKNLAVPQVRSSAMASKQCSPTSTLLSCLSSLIALRFDLEGCNRLTPGLPTAQRLELSAKPCF
jgi:hypothetical protein